MNPEPIAGVPDDRSLGYRRSEWQPDRRDVSRAEQRRDTVPISKAPLSLAARAVGPTNKAARRKSRPVVDDVIVFLSNRRRRRRRRRRSRTSPRPAICKFRMQMSRRGFVHDTFSMVFFPRSSVRSFFLGGGGFIVARQARPCRRTIKTEFDWIAFNWERERVIGLPQNSLTSSPPPITGFLEFDFFVLSSFLLFGRG